MWLVAVEKSEEFDALGKAFIKGNKSAYESLGTPFGASFLGPKESAPNLPAFVLLDRDFEHNKEVLRWCYKNLQLEAFIASGVSQPLSPLDENDLVFCPTKCVRAAGSLDLFSGPVLYEEHRFDDGLRTRLLDFAKSQPFPTLGEKKIFSSERPIEGEELIQIVSEKLKCMTKDRLSGDLLRFCNAMSVPRASLFLLLQERSVSASSSLSDFSALWEKLFEEGQKATSPI